VKKHGGQTNAFTDMESTNYYFDISNDAFSEALDRFAQFFISPLFTEEAGAREMKAVHNEHSKNIQEDLWRMFQLLKSTANKQHPFSKFGTGNLKTLDEIPKSKELNIRQELLKFHSTYYSANIMKLVVLSNQSIDSLVQLVTDLFSEIENKQIPHPSASYNDTTVFTKDHLSKLYKVVPVREMRELILIFPVRIENDEELYIVKQDRYLTHLLGMSLELEIQCTIY
jgi:insulysin